MTTSMLPDPSGGAHDSMGEPQAGMLETIQKRDLWRFWMLVFFLVIGAVIVVLSLVVHQVLQAGQATPYGAAHQGQSPRGVIVDANGDLLAGDRFFYQISATPKNIENAEDRLKVADQLETLAEIPAADTFKLLTDYAEFAYVELAPSVSLAAGQRVLDEQALLAEEVGTHPLLEVTLTPTPQRFYPEGELAAHLVGMLALPENSSWLQGFYGLEGYYDRFLQQRNSPGLTAPSSVTLQDLPQNVRRFMPSVANKDLVLTIDRSVQAIVEDELGKGLERYRAQAGTIIVMDPRTGAILAMANLPTYDPNDLSESDIEALQNTAISAQYEPGSVFKVVTAAAALDSGVVTPTQKLTDTGSIAVGSRVILNSNRAAYGPVDMTEALARSLNVITAQWALLMGADTFYHYVDKFGFGTVTNIDLAGEVYGAVKQPESRSWSESDLGTNSFGQGLAVTPIQMINAVAAIANGGRLMRPYLVAARVADGYVQYTEPTVIGKPLKPTTAQQLSKMFVDVVNQGNSAAGVAGYSIAGKSGTAQIPTEEGYTEDETIVTFVGFAPADDPAFVILVKMDDRIRRSAPGLTIRRRQSLLRSHAACSTTMAFPPMIFD